MTIETNYERTLAKEVLGMKAAGCPMPAAATLLAQAVMETPRSESERTWISMKERQPADFERVLCVNSNGYMTTAIRFHDTGLGTWNGSDYTAEEHYELVIGDIKHWMPLPEAPK